MTQSPVTCIVLLIVLIISTAQLDKKPTIPILHGVNDLPSDMPTQNQEYVQQQYQKFMSERKKKPESDKSKVHEQTPPPTPPKGMSPRKLNIVREESDVELPKLTEQVIISGGEYWMGTQLDIAGKLTPATRTDGAAPRKRVVVKSFAIDVDCVTNEQFHAFVRSTSYKTESELYGWSFVFQGQASRETIAAVDDPETGYGRVKNALHWMAVANASWTQPFGVDSSVLTGDNYFQGPVVQVSHTDAVEYCAWASGGLSSANGGLRLPSEKEWEYAARGRRVNMSYPWGNDYHVDGMNIWTGEFPEGNDGADGFIGIAPIKSYPPNDYGVYNMLGNVWEWVLGGKAAERILRGGSFIDSIDGKFNHMVVVSTRQTNSGDSAASNIGFRCARSMVSESSKSKSKSKKQEKIDSDTETEHIEL